MPTLDQLRQMVVSGALQDQLPAIGGPNVPPASPAFPVMPPQMSPVGQPGGYMTEPTQSLGSGLTTGGPMSFGQRFALGLAQNPLQPSPWARGGNAFTQNLLASMLNSYAGGSVNEMQKTDLLNRQMQQQTAARNATNLQATLESQKANEQEARGVRQAQRLADIADIKQQRPVTPAIRQFASKVGINLPDDQKTLSPEEFGMLDTAMNAQSRVDVAGIRAMAQQQGADANILQQIQSDPEALRMVSLRYLRDGTMPSLGMSKQGIQVRWAIIKGASKLGQQLGMSDIASNAASFRSNQKALGNVTNMQASLDSFTGAVNKNIDVLKQTMKAIPDFNSKWANRPMRAVAEGLGSAGMAGYKTMLYSVSNDAARIVTSPVMSAQPLSIQAQKDAKMLIDGSYTVPQSLEALGRLQQEFKNRSDANKSEIDRLRTAVTWQGLNAGPAYPGGAGGVQNLTPPSAPEVWTRDKNGNLVKSGGQ